MLGKIQSVLQWFFLRMDGVGNRVFGERLNPMYYLGATSYWMFWLVVASGLYVYAFYETGVDKTYASMQAITHGQWFAGGILRSVHRYASDAMVLTMLLHMLRHFAFDRHRGFRAFSWITGVVVMWLVYVSGVNGFMLPWDRLAQFVVVATTEWLDALPAFRGILTRNFITPEAVSDRLFSLLSFLHIGIPLVVLLALWIHTQRVPRASQMPPRPLALGLALMLLVLSLARPVIGQAPADFASFPAVLDFDWFYLSVYPLIYAWDPLWLWGALAAGTLLLFALPWLPPARYARGEPRRMTVHPGRVSAPVRPGETLLDAGLRAGVPLPFECRSGGCGVCKATLVGGEVEMSGYQKSALSDDERAAGRILTCCATAVTDVEFEYEENAAARGVAIGHYAATVERLEKLAHDVMLLALRLQDGARISYVAGQYVNVILEDGARRSYSFTAPSGETDLVELHVRRVPGGRFTTRVFESMKLGDRLEFEGPIGSFVLHEPSDKPLIFVAGATGFAPVKSLLEQAFRLGIERPLYLYWGVRQKRDLYLAELPERWAREHPNFRFVPVLSEPAPGDAWQGRTGLVHEAILADFPDLTGLAVYACGSVRMVEAARPAFVAQGLSEDACYSDAFVPAGGAGPAR
ncbi:FAD-binding oxidoreductase [Burkholderiaceae bacterium FT117]|nr:2Fe-2S iron-sulfur cluster-binding protein [Zeimonas sediminis]MCM5569496.1 FAD-binding oxidoreductase [Zeimonas sediminis]